MAEETNRRYAVVTGSNKGIGFETVRQLASNGIIVVLTARGEEGGLEALQKLQRSGLSDQVLFHQLDVSDPSSITSFSDFIKTQFGKLDILINNAGVPGAIVDGEALAASGHGKDGAIVDMSKIFVQTYELAEECVKTNYYGTKRMIEAFVPLLQLSNSPRIVNISSSNGILKNLPNEWARGVLGDAERLTEERVDEVLGEYLKDFKEERLESNGWPTAYNVSKAAVSAYTRIVAKKYPSFRVNCVCPGYVKTDMNHHTGFLTVEEGAESPVRLALLPNDGPSGLFFVRNEVSSFD